MLSDGDLTLRPMTPEDLDALYRWDVDPQTHFIAGGPRPLVPVTAERYRERFTSRQSGPDSEDYTITVEGQQVGYCQLAMFDHLARSAMVGIVLAPDARGQHVGRRAIRLLVDHAFRDRGLHRVWLGTLAHNEAGLRAYRAAGFVEETRERERTWVEGRYADEIRMGILRSEWESSADADR